MAIQVAYYHSPIGWLEIRASKKGITHIDYVDEKGEHFNRSALLKKCRDQLQEYFERKRKVFNLPLDLDGTDFQVITWKEIKKIPFGKTITYQQLSHRLGDPHSERAAGNATGKNPINIVIPCHRVIASDGKLTGYRGGLKRKKWLLEFEGAFSQMDLFPMIDA
jgi:methylated-DNA-[protein]-cysteine S-methyltransferase